MSQPNTCEVCGATYRNEDGPHACKADALLERLEEAEARIAELEEDGDRLDWIDEDPFGNTGRLRAVERHLLQFEHDFDDVRDAIDDLRNEEEMAEE